MGLGGSAKTLYTLLPIVDEYGEQDLRKTKRLAHIFGSLLMAVSVLSLCFYAWRLCVLMKSGGGGDAFFGLLAALTSAVAIQAMSAAFAALFLLGTAKEQQSLIFLWLISVFVLLALDTVVTVYTAALRDHDPDLAASPVALPLYVAKLAVNIPAIVMGVAMYRAIEEYRKTLDFDREILL